MNLHKNKNLFKEAVAGASQFLKIREVFIEKDYWVTYTLKNLSASNFKNITVFKGGTSLSKAFGLIRRFSEDIDLGIIMPADYTSDQIENTIISIENKIAGDFRRIDIEGLTIKTKKYRKTIYEYDKLSSDKNFGLAMDKIVLEINSYATTHPHHQRKIQSYIADYLVKNNHKDIITKYNLQHFKIKVLDVTRTIVEKMTAIVRACYSAEPVKELQNKIRHIYDITLIYQESNIKGFLDSNDLYLILDRVDQEDNKNPFVPKESIGKPFSEALIYKDPVKTWKLLEPTYKTIFKSLVFEKLPESIAIIRCLKYLQSRFKEYESYRLKAT